MSRLRSVAVVELVGLPVAITFMDTALKSADVTLVGYELSWGGGLVTVKLTGNVGALKAAVEAGVASAGTVGRVASKVIIPRPAAALEKVIFSRTTVGLTEDVKDDTECDEPQVSPEVTDRAAEGSEAEGTADANVPECVQTEEKAEPEPEQEPEKSEAEEEPHPDLKANTEAKEALESSVQEETSVDPTPAAETHSEDSAKTKKTGTSQKGRMRK